MTPHLLAQQLRQRQRCLVIIPDEDLDELSDDAVIHGYCVGAAGDEVALKEIIAKSETAHDFLDKLISDREAAKRMWPPCAAANEEDDLRNDVDESMSDLLRYMPVSHLRDFGSPIFYVFTEVMVQEFVTQNFGSPLAQDELSDLHFAFCDSFYDDFLDEVISTVRARAKN